MIAAALWARVLRVLTQHEVKNEEMAPSLCDLCQCQSFPTVSAHPRWCRGFSKKGLQRLNRAGQKKNLWNMLQLWFLLSDVRSSECSMPILSYLASFESSSPLPSFYYTSSFRFACCSLSLAFLSSEFWGGEGLCEFFSPRGMELHFVSQSISITTEREGKLLLWYTSHTHIHNKQHMQAGWQNF